MRDRDEHPAQPPKVQFCEACGCVHPAAFTVNAATLGWMASLATSTVLTYHSRGGILPRPVGRPNGNPRWLTCVVVAWLKGLLPAEQLEPRRATRAR